MPESARINLRWLLRLVFTGGGLALGILAIGSPGGAAGTSAAPATIAVPTLSLSPLTNAATIAVPTLSLGPLSSAATIVVPTLSLGPLTNAATIVVPTLSLKPK
jgi:hypothetical protein